MTQGFNIAAFRRLMEQTLGGPTGEAGLFWRALDFAVSAHTGQVRKSGEDFISHPCGVAEILVKEMGVRAPDVLAAALLHDTIEDVSMVTAVVLGELFGKNVEILVDGCTKISHFIGDRQTFMKHVHRKIFSEAATHIEVMVIKLADRLHNLRTLESLPKWKRQKIAEETLDIYAPMAQLMGLYELKRELYSLALTYKFPRQSQKVMTIIHQLLNSADIQTIKRRLEEEMRRVWLDGEVEVRAKGLGAYYDQHSKRLAREIKFPLEFVIKVADIQSCYRALGVLHQMFPPIPRTIRDFIANPKPSGYQSLHSRANIWGQNYLFKVRTVKMADSHRIGMLQKWSARGEIVDGFEKELQEMFNIMGSDEGVSYRDLIAASGKKEIYTYTPNGDRIVLPHQSVVLDFAFKVHSELGEMCSHALVGSEKVGLDHVLQDGDRIKIVTQDEPPSFDPELQNICQTPRARSGLARIFRARRLALARDVGFSILVQEVRRYGMPVEVLEMESLADLMEYFGFPDKDEFFAGIGEGRIRLKEIFYELRHGIYAGWEAMEPPTGALNRIYLSTIDPLCIKLSQCCNPLPTEKGLLGLLSERGVSVHNMECKKFRDLKLQREDLVELRWKLKETIVKKPQKIYLSNAARSLVLAILSSAPSEMRITEVIALSRLPTLDLPWQVDFDVATLFGLKKILRHFIRAGLGWDFGLEQ